jgi:hypothetical protein
MSDTMMAYGVYYYDTQKVGHGMTGQILDTGSSRAVVPDVNTGFNGDPTVHPFLNGTTALYAATDYTYGQNRNVFIYDIEGSLQTTVSGGWSSVTNLTGLVRFGGYLYAIDYDNARVVEINPSTYVQTGRTYTYTAPTGYTAYGVTLTEANNTLYALFMIVDNPWATTPVYLNSVAVQLDTTTTAITAAASNSGLEKNAFTLVENNGYLYVCSIGGKQKQGSCNADAKLQRIAISSFTGTPATLMTAANVGDHDFHDITFNGTTAFVLVGNYDINYNMTGELFSTTDYIYANRTSISPFTGGTNDYYWGILFTAELSRLWFAKGNSIELFSAAGSSVANIPFSSLISSGESYTNLNDLAYVGAYTSGTGAKVASYRSHMQRSATPRAVALRSITKGRPEATEDEIKQADAIVAKA